MKQSDIAEAIEQNLSPNTHTYIISGHSDDIIQIDGPNCGNGIELYPTSSNFSFLFTDGHTTGRIIVSLMNDQWGFGIAPYSDGVMLPIGEYKLALGLNGYSTVLTISSMFPLTFSEE